MCTLAVLLRQSSRFPLVMAANRDESRERPARAPFVWDTSPRFIAGRDEQAGGTWLGLNEDGVLAGLTNLWTSNPPDPSRASRGDVVRRALRHRRWEDARAWARDLDPEATNPFLLVCADVTGQAFWTATAIGMAIHELGPGIHTFGNHLPSEPPRAKLSRMTQRFERAWTDHPDQTKEMLPVLQEAVASHTAGLGPQDSICVHTDTVYGTVSSLIAMLREPLTESRLFYADGPPCTTPFGDISGLLGELG